MVEPYNSKRIFIENKIKTFYIIFPSHFH